VFVAVQRQTFSAAPVVSRKIWETVQVAGRAAVNP
jgi:hypothetical protein